jgi:cell division protein FtsI (penicillin-binding protein 3)/stage V sporulation protein D (sporulation-specific penicillin-binding protein)
MTDWKAETDSYRKAQWYLVFVAMGVYLAFLIQVHLFPDPRAASQLSKQYHQSERMAMDRGSIYDSNGEPLALSVTTYSVFLDPGVENFDPKSLDKMAKFIGKQKTDAIRKKLDRRFYWVKRYMEREEAEEIVRTCGKGFYIREERKRIYPKGSQLSHILGYCDQDGWGLAGVELTWNGALVVPEKLHITYRGASSSAEIGGESADRTPAAQEHGLEQGLYLTIDSDIQYALERFLGAQAAEYKVPWAAAVCLETKTGAVKAMASYPTFDSNNRATFSNLKALSNNAVNRVYEPGSTFKPVMVAMALEQGRLRQGDSFRCPAYLKVADGVIRDSHPRDNGIMNVSQILIKSSNVGMAHIGMRMPPVTTYMEMRSWGIGKRTGIRLNGEEPGLLPTADRWYGITPANVAIGQGFALTPLQLATAFNAIINDGVLVRPYLVRSAVNSEGLQVFHSEPMEVDRVVSQKNARWIRSVLRKVVTEGTGKPAESSAVHVGGKTGTAQVARKGKYVKGLYNSSFIGFWPANDPKYTMLIVFGDVTGKVYYGGALAAPVFKQVVDEVERLKGIGVK